MPRHDLTGAMVVAVVGGQWIGVQAGEQGVIGVRCEDPKAADDRLRSGGAGRHGALAMGRAGRTPSSKTQSLAALV